MSAEFDGRILQMLRKKPMRRHSEALFLPRRIPPFLGLKQEGILALLGMTPLFVCQVDNDAPRQPRLLSYLLDLRRILLDRCHVFAGAGGPDRNGLRPFLGRGGHHFHVLSGIDFLRISLTGVRVPVATIDGLIRSGATWQWVLAGTILALPIAWGVRWASRVTDSMGLQGAGRQIAIFLFVGLRGIAEHHALLGLPVAALTSAVLFLIHRAFEQRGES